MSGGMMLGIVGGVLLALLIGLLLQTVLLRVSLSLAAKFGLTRHTPTSELAHDAHIAPLADSLAADGRTDSGHHLGPLGTESFGHCFKTIGLAFLVNIPIRIALTAIEQGAASASGGQVPPAIGMLTALLGLVLNVAVLTWAIQKRHDVTTGTALAIVGINVLIVIMIVVVIGGALFLFAR